jgi:hypothetical protein|uniref:Methyltransferase domain-containing protein n=1 Tax=Phaeodactylum tricornutum TaxID=2850 RepID=A0A8J9TDA8_PHATR
MVRNGNVRFAPVRTINKLPRFFFCASGFLALLVTTEIWFAPFDFNFSLLRATYAVQLETPSPLQSTDLAASHSFGFFDDIPNETWKLMRSKALAFQHYMYPNSPDIGSERPWFWYLNNLQPDFTCSHVFRVGGHGDGPKWVCDPHRLRKKEDDCLVYSFGSNGQYQFEDGLIDLIGHERCEIHVFDFGNFDRSQNAGRNIHYHKWGLGSSYDEAYNIKLKSSGRHLEILTFQETQQRLNHVNRTIDLFKIDCEWCEWSNYKDWVDVDARQILVEVHGLPSTNPATNPLNTKGSDFFNAFRENSYAMFSKELNPYNSECYEIGYIKLAKEFWKSSTEDESPTILSTRF